MQIENQPIAPALEWCLPVVYDCLSEFYHDLLPATNSARTNMTQVHFAIWTMLAREEFDHLPASFYLFVRQAHAQKIDVRTRRAGDRYVASEILDLCSRRFHRNPEKARLHNAALLTLLERLQRLEQICATQAPLARAA